MPNGRYTSGSRAFGGSYRKKAWVAPLAVSTISSENSGIHGVGGGKLQNVRSGRTITRDPNPAVEGYERLAEKVCSADTVRLAAFPMLTPLVSLG